MKTIAGNDPTGGNRSTGRKLCASATLYTQQHVSVKTVLGGIFGPKEEEVRGRWKMPREELRNVYCLQKL